MFLACLSSTRWTGQSDYQSTPRFRPRSFCIDACRAGANPERVLNQIRQKLRIKAAMVNMQMGEESNFQGVIDLVRWKAIYNEGEKG